MCFPAIVAALPAISAGVGAGSAILGYAGQRQQAKQQAAYQAQSAAAERQRALQEQSSIRMRQAQEQEATARELEQVSRKSQEALARARVSAGEAGVAGASVQALMDDYTRQEAGYRAATLRQQELSAVGTQLGLEQAGLASQQRLISINQPISKPSFLTAGLEAVSGGLSGYRTGLDIKSRMKTPSSVIPKGTISGSTASYAPGTPGGSYLKY
jgi:hypothetical protein